MSSRTNTIEANSERESHRRFFPRSRVRDLALLLAIGTAYHWNEPMAIAGAGLILVGLALQSWSKAVLRRNRELGTDGPYAICRHPFYLGNFVFDVGLCVLSGNWWLVAVYPVIFWIGYRPTIRYEEALLRGAFGQAHVAYSQRTPRLFPSFLGLARRWRSTCSLQVMLKERQVSRAIRLLALPLWVVLAARTWNAPGSLSSDRSLGLIATAVVLALLGHLVYRVIEKPAVPYPANQHATAASSL